MVYARSTGRSDSPGRHGRPLQCRREREGPVGEAARDRDAVSSDRIGVAATPSSVRRGERRPGRRRRVASAAEAGPVGATLGRRVRRTRRQVRHVRWSSPDVNCMSLYRIRAAPTQLSRARCESHGTPRAETRGRRRDGLRRDRGRRVSKVRPRGVLRPATGTDVPSRSSGHRERATP